MRTLEYTVRFTTPAFLGDAEQNGRWRTPPFKALLRQWWRVAYAADHGFQVRVADMRHEEGRLFGHAWLDDDRDERGQNVAARRSMVRIRLSHWTGGSEKKGDWGQQELQPNTRVSHPEVGQIGPLLYLGYGPLAAEPAQVQGRRQYATVLKKNAAIQAGESTTFSIAVPDENSQSLLRALWLMDRYGTAGGRSRNGWGSFSLTPLNDTPALTGDLPLRPWREALGLDWPHAIGRDNTGPLVWTTSPFAEWRVLMRQLAVVKIGMRTQFLFTAGRDAPHPEARHWMSYPVTKHNVAAWRERGRGDFRLPNSLRLKIRSDANDPNKLVGVIFHVPCLPPMEFRPDPQAIDQTWESVHALLSELTRLPQLREYASVRDADRRETLKAQLDGVTLARAPE